MSGSKTHLLLTEPKDASYGYEAIESMAHCVQGLLLQDKGFGESQARYNIHIATCVTQRQTKLQASLLIPVFGFQYVRCASMCGCEHVWMCARVNVYMHV